METIFDQSIVKREKPINFKPEDEDIFCKALISKRPACHVLRLRDVFVVKDTLFDPRTLKVYDEYSHVNKISKLGKLKRMFWFLSRRRNLKINNAVWIIDAWSANYWHWFIDCLPRLLMSERFLENHVIILPERFSGYSFISESLNLLNYSVQYFDPNKNLKVGDLVLPSEIGRFGEYQKELLLQVKRRFVGNEDVNIGFRKTYIRRRKGKARNISNENKVIEVLKGNDFEIHFFEDYSLMEQIRIISETKTLVCMHGAGLTNMLFMPIGANVLEFRNSFDGSIQTNCFFTLAAELGINYYYTTNKSTSHLTNHADFEIDIEKLKIALIEMEN